MNNLNTKGAGTQRDGMSPELGRSSRMRSPFCILTQLGDLLDDGESHFVEAVKTLEIANQRIEALAKSRPGQYVIYNEETGARVSITVCCKESNKRKLRRA